MGMTYNTEMMDAKVEAVETLGKIIGDTSDAQMELLTILADIMNILNGKPCDVAKQPDIKCFADACAINREFALRGRDIALQIRAAFGG